MTFNILGLGAVGLFVGALLDALIGPNLFIPGEPFLIAAGYQLQQGTSLGVILVLTGGWIGDQTSYWIGSFAGKKVQRKLTKWQPKMRKPFAKVRLLMIKRGGVVLMLSRLLGPISWVVPFWAGANRIPYFRFTILSTIGLILGVGQFILWGYLLSYGIEFVPFIGDIALFGYKHLYCLLVVISTLTFIIIGFHKKWRYLRFCRKR